MANHGSLISCFHTRDEHVAVVFANSGYPAKGVGGEEGARRGETTFRCYVFGTFFYTHLWTKSTSEFDALPRLHRLWRPPSQLSDGGLGVGDTAVERGGEVG